MPHTHLLRTLIGDVCVLEDMTVHLPIIEIRIVECRGGSKGYKGKELGDNIDQIISLYHV